MSGLLIERLALRIGAASPLRHCSLQVRPGAVVTPKPFDPDAKPATPDAAKPADKKG